MNKGDEANWMKGAADRSINDGLNEGETSMAPLQSDADELFERGDGFESLAVIVRMKENFEEIREREVSRYRRRQLKHLTDAELRHVDELTRRIISKILHKPIMAMEGERDRTWNGNNDESGCEEKIQIIEELFRMKL